MSGSRKAPWIAILAAALVLPLAGLVITANLHALQQDTDQPGPMVGPPATPIPGVPSQGTDRDESPDISRIQERQALARNEDRQKELVKDTDKLLALATELQSEVSKTNKDMLSVEVIKKAEEIQKLAKSVQQKMKAN